MNWYTALLVSGGVGCLVSIIAVQACNEAICAPIVSKCMLLKSCEACDMATNATCNWKKHCAKCLAQHYGDCCPCVDLCKSKDNEDSDRDSSTVEDLKEPIPDLFQVLTEEEDDFGRWKSVTFKTMSVMPSRGILHINDPKEKNSDVVIGETNCTVAFMGECMSMRKCKTSCQSMGASQYRWFHNHACCQCIGDTCLNYGLNKPKCHNCPPHDEMDDIEREERYMEELNRQESDVIDNGDDDDDEDEDDNVDII